LGLRGVREARLAIGVDARHFVTPHAHRSDSLDAVALLPAFCQLDVHRVYGSIVPDLSTASIASATCNMNVAFTSVANATCNLKVAFTSVANATCNLKVAFTSVANAFGKEFHQANAASAQRSRRTSVSETLAPASVALACVFCRLTVTALGPVRTAFVDQKPPWPSRLVRRAF
jgi:hypothetical protein